jgi:riboflavin kinase/FMN adenylyltransferase
MPQRPGRFLSERRPTFGKVVATIGVFDGLHRGHQLIFHQVLTRSEELGARPVVVTFDPYPVEVFRPDRPPERLQTPAQRRRLLLEMGFHGVLDLVFSSELARESPEGFVDQVLLGHLDLEELYTGYDFHFGRDRQGSIAELETLGAQRGFRVFQVPALVEEGLPISSSRVRDGLREGRVEWVSGLLGRAHALEGTVVRGRGEGGRLLVPTANIQVDPRILLPRKGVYVVEVDVDGRLWGGVMNVGRRPTLTDDRRCHVEVHVLDWEGDLLGRRVQVHLLKRLRREMRFPGLTALKSAIQNDIARAREWVGRPARRQSPVARG